MVTVHDLHLCVRAQFPGRSNDGLRRILREAIGGGSVTVRNVAARVAFTARGRAGLDAVASAVERYEREQDLAVLDAVAAGASYEELRDKHGHTMARMVRAGLLRLLSQECRYTGNIVATHMHILDAGRAVLASAHGVDHAN